MAFIDFCNQEEKNSECGSNWSLTLSLVIMKSKVQRCAVRPRAHCAVFALLVLLVLTWEGRELKCSDHFLW